MVQQRTPGENNLQRGTKKNAKRSKNFTFHDKRILNNFKLKKIKYGLKRLATIK
jgi:hypothetical protein